MKKKFSINSLRIQSSIFIFGHLDFLALTLVLALTGGCARFSSSHLSPYERSTWADLEREMESQQSEPAGGAILAGTARIDITPPDGTPLAGFGRRKGKPSLGTHDPLKARALVARSGAKTVVWISLDMMAAHKELFEAVYEKLREPLAIAPSDLFLMASHTHSGSGALAKRWAMERVSGSFDEEVFKLTVERLTKVTLDAAETMESSRWGAGEVTVAGTVQNRMKENGPVDETLRLVRIDREDGTPLAFLVNFSAHPTLLGASNMEFSGDFPGYLARSVEEIFPGAQCLFINGAAADLKPKAGDLPTAYERSAAYGKLLAERAARLVGEIKTEPVKKLSSVGVTAQLPPVRVHAGRFALPHWIGSLFFDRETPVGVVRVGSILFLSVPGELSVEIGLAVAQYARAHNLKPVIMGYTNDFIGYVLREADYDLPEYEARVSFYGRKLGPYLERLMYREIDLLLGRAGHTRAGRIQRDDLTILYLEGKPYDLGFQHGTLLKEEIHAQWQHIMKYARSQVPIPLFNRVIIRWKLDSAWRNMAPFVSDDHKEEMRGLARGAEISLATVHRAHAIPDLFPTLCANGAFFGEATADGRVIHLRNLDWSRGMGVHERAIVFIVRPEDKHAFINLGYAGFIGVLSGINENGLSVGQIGCDTVDFTLQGEPMPLLLRRVLEESQDLDHAAMIVKEARRTYGYNYVFADAKARRALALETTAHHFSMFLPNDLRERDSGYGFALKDAIIRSDTAFDETIRNLQTASKGDPRTPGLEAPGGSAYEIRYKKHCELAAAQSGHLTGEKTVEIAREIAPGSNIQSVVFAYPDLWVANAAGDTRAADQPYHHFSIPELFGKES